MNLSNPDQAPPCPAPAPGQQHDNIMSQGSSASSGMFQFLADNVFRSPRRGGHSRNPSDMTDVLLNVELKASTFGHQEVNLADKDTLLKTQKAKLEKYVMFDCEKKIEALKGKAENAKVLFGDAKVSLQTSKDEKQQLETKMNKADFQLKACKMEVYRMKDLAEDADKKVRDTANKTLGREYLRTMSNPLLYFIQVDEEQAKYEYCKYLVQTPDESKPYASLSLASIREDAGLNTKEGWFRISSIVALTGEFIRLQNMGFEANPEGPGKLAIWPKSIGPNGEKETKDQYKERLQEILGWKPEEPESREEEPTAVDPEDPVDPVLPEDQPTKAQKRRYLEEQLAALESSGEESHEGESHGDGPPLKKRRT